MATSHSNPLMPEKKSTDGLHVLLHPLVLLTISDYITRHTVRQQEGPIVGALLGQQSGREVSLEHAFECKVTIDDEGRALRVTQSWFEERLQQFKDVLKAPPLDLVGWFTIAPASGPQDVHLPLHKSFLHYNESAVLLAFHPDQAAEGGSSGGKLPVTVYESVYEASSGSAENDAGQLEASTMDMDGPAITFRELPYAVETEETERIGVEFVAKGGGNATAVETTETGDASLGMKRGGRDQPAMARDGRGLSADETADLSPEDEELISTLNARINAVRMLHSRIRLIQTYLAHLPASYLTDPSSTVIPPLPSTDAPADPSTETSYPVLRAIQALLNRLPTVIPADKAAFEKEVLAEKNDVSLVALLGGLNKNVKEMRDVGRRFAMLETGIKAKNAAAAGNISAPAGEDLFGDGAGTKEGVLW